MSKKSLLLVLAVGLYAISSAHAATIIWVSDNKTPDAVGVPADQGWVDLLVNNGYTVNLSFRNKEGRTLDATKLAALEAADLIIISRDTSSGDYDDGTEPAQWNSVTTPIIMQVAHIARSAHWGWLNTTSTNDSLQTMVAVEPSHYVFKGVNLDANNQVSALTIASSFASTTDAGNGTLIAKRADNNQVWIVEWQAGQEFYAGSGRSAGGPRMFFASSTNSGTDGRYNLTADGEKIFLNAVRYMLGETGKALEPDPAGAEEDVVRDVVLSWTPGENVAAANGHILYLSETKDDVINGIGGITLSMNSYTVPQRLRFGTKYYWRVDQVEAAPSSKVNRGDVWSFTTEPVTYLVTNIQATASSSANADAVPAKTVDGSGLTQAADGRWVHGIDEKTMWQSALTQTLPATIAFEFDRVYKLQQMKVWNHNTTNEPAFGLGAKEVTIEIADSNSGPWTLLADVTLNKAPGLPDTPATDTIPMNGVMASNVRLTIHSNHGTVVSMPAAGLAEVQFFYIPVAPRELEPADGTALTGTEVTLAWRSGREAAQHKVYIDVNDNRASVENSSPTALVATVPAQGSYASYTASGLNLAQTYVWKIAEVNTVETPAVHDSPIRSFTTPAFGLVDDMESYQNVEYMEIWAAWLDGTEFGTNDPTNGSVVGADPAMGDYSPAAGRNGGQSLPIWFTNTAAAPKSEAVCNSPFGDWTGSGIKSLSLWFRGDLANSGSGRLYVKINNGAPIYYDGDPTDLAKASWRPFNIDLSKVAGTLKSITKLTIGVEGVGAKGVVYVDDIRLYPLTPEYTTPVQPGTANLLAYYDFEGNANDRSGHGLNGTVVDGQLASPGKLGQGLGLQVNDAGYADLGNPALLDFSTGDWTLAAWFKTAITGTGDANKGTIVGKGGDNTGGKRYALIMSEEVEGIVTLVCDDDVTKELARSTTTTNDDQWHFVVGLREGTAIKIYIDGYLEGTEPVDAAYDLSGTTQHNAYIGAMTDNRDGTLYKTFIGSIDEVRIYNRALSEGEIAGLAGKTGRVPKPF
jgi:hypothetical protein